MKFTRLQPGKQTNATHILPNISRSKGNQKMKFGRLIEYNMRNVIVEYHTQNVVKKLSPDLYLKNQNLWINSVNF